MEISSTPVLIPMESIINQDQARGRRKGGLMTVPFVIANEAFEKVASIGLHANMILYLTNEYHLSNAYGMSIMFLWNAISNFMPAFGALLSDSYFGRFHIIALGTLVTSLGLIMLWFTALFKEARPPPCNKNINSNNCMMPDAAQLSLLFSSFALISIGAGCIRPCSMAFGADQFNKQENPKNERVLQSFFNWYYASVGISILFSVTVIVYIQTKFGWAIGFGVTVGLSILSTIVFLLGSSLYVKVKANKNMIKGFVRVIHGAMNNKDIPFPPKESSNMEIWYHHKKDSLFSTPTQKLRFLNKACLIRYPEKEYLNSDGTPNNSSLCTVQEVEELKALIKVLPIWSTGIMMAVSMNLYSFLVLQANTMDRHFIKNINIQIPPGSFGAFGILTMIIWVAIYDCVLVQRISKVTKRSRGLSLKQRMGTGLLLSCIALAISALVEKERRLRAIREGFGDNPKAVVYMSAMWLVPQQCLSGLAEGLNIIGQIEFYYSQLPKNMASIGVALFSVGMAIGNLVGILIVGIVDNVTKRGGKVSWISNNLNRGHYDYYYWIITLLSVVNFFYYLLCSWAYGSEEGGSVWDIEENEKENKDLIVLDS
ncbi:protein NRT1/ PTR FAMILY 1.2-like [Impatiens glandulifera]|uniref:protein NRT1/ PTR FAMILY 1.2-like n=1 Tax=Impatiens glandulifera TaxID=253017 RepID=UPI001FB16E47|nr:protein NRT1/ PTR FAMILY 1.2-like [Impatiens glandulifera]